MSWRQKFFGENLKFKFKIIPLLLNKFFHPLLNFKIFFSAKKNLFDKKIFWLAFISKVQCSKTFVEREREREREGKIDRQTCRQTERQGEEKR